MTAPQDPFSTPSQGDGAPGGGQSAGFGQPAYGQPAYGQPAYGQPASGGGPTRNGLGIAALVLGILSLFSWFLFIGGLLGLIAVILGFLGRGRAKRGEATNGGMALAGIITGALGVLLTALAVAGIATVLDRGGFSDLKDCLAQAGSDQAAIDRCSTQFENRVRGS